MTTNNFEEDVRFIDVFALQNAFIIQYYKKSVNSVECFFKEISLVLGA